jgi:hypothetical protein
MLKFLTKLSKEREFCENRPSDSDTLLTIASEFLPALSTFLCQFWLPSIQEIFTCLCCICAFRYTVELGYNVMKVTEYFVSL